MTTPSPKTESALVAIFREVNLPQLLVLFAALTAVIVPVLKSQHDDDVKERIARATTDAVTQVRLEQLAAHMDKTDKRQDEQGLILARLGLGQTESKTTTANLVQIVELMRQDVQALRSHIR